MSPSQGAGDPSERRDNRRFDLEVAVQATYGGKTVDGTSEDISAGGMKLRIVGEELPPKIGERLDLSFRLPLLADPILTQGEIRWVTRGKMCGVQFTTGLRAREVWAINRLHSRR